MEHSKNCDCPECQAGHNTRSNSHEFSERELSHSSIRDLQINREKRGDSVVLVIHGSMDTLGVAEHGGEITGALRECSSLLLDMKGVHFLASAGIRLILKIAQRAKEEGKTFQLTGLQPLVRKTLQIAGITRVIEII